MVNSWWSQSKDAGSNPAGSFMFFSKLLPEFYELGCCGNYSNANSYLGHYEDNQTGLDLEADWGHIRGS